MAEPFDIDAPLVEIGHHFEATLRIAGEDRSPDALDTLPIDHPQQVQDFNVHLTIDAEGQHLFQQTLGVPHAAFGFAGNGVKNRFL